MAYQLQEILGKGDVQDFRVFLDIIENRFSFTDDNKLCKEYDEIKTNPTDKNRDILTKHLERCIRYFGSSEFVYFKRYFMDKVDPPGNDIQFIISDVSKHLKLPQKILTGSIENNLKTLVKSTAEKTFFKLSDEDQRKLFDKAGLSKDEQKEFLKKVKENKALFFPIMLSMLGPQVLQDVITGITVAVITKSLGEAAAKRLLTELGTKVPLWTSWLGPIVWSLTVGWLVFDIQKPAFRKTVPLLLYLGIIVIREQGLGEA